MTPSPFLPYSIIEPAKMKGIISASAIGFLLGLWITDWSMATAIATVNGILGGLC